MSGAPLRRAWARLPGPLRQLVASGVATCVDTAVLLALVHGAGLVAGVAAALGCLVGGAVNFAITRAWVFAARDRAWVGQALRYGVIVVGGGAVVSGLAVAALGAAGLPLLVGKAIAVVVTMLAWTYPLSARVVFAAAPTPTSAPAAAGAR
ncbi:MAG: GtrA family protein [Myxococcales bacterium]|nr:GtrA family protein [Myxococcales bacterium]